MARTIEWEIPAEIQPKPEDCAFDLDRALGAVLGVHATVPEDAFTAGTLGTERAGSGVLIRKANKGYSLFRADNGKPVARLRPTGKKDQVEVMWWSHRDKWDQIGDFGPMLMPLEEALHYIARNAMGCFW